MMSEMVVAFTFNKYYLRATEVSIYSLLASRKSDVPLRIVLVFEDNVRDGDLAVIREMVREAPCAGLELYRPEQLFGSRFIADENSCAPQEGIQVSFYRVYLPKLLPEYDRCLFLDSDLVVRKDLSALYETDLSGICFAGVTDRLCLEETQLRRMRTYGIPAGRYINSGVMMMNLKRLRENGVDDRLLTCGSSQAFPYLDQDLINFVCPEEIGLLPKEYNVFPDDTEKEWASWQFPGNRTLACALSDPAIFHYIGPDKPWEKPVPGSAYWLEAEAGFCRWKDRQAHNPEVAGSDPSPATI